MNKPQVFRWKSNRFEIHQGEGSHYFWLMKATKREERMPFTLAEIKELRELLDQVLRDCETDTGPQAAT
ncbi:MAG TPA: hypothetical protein PKH77_19145 [Anaerolineae bacterium]|nr:hypothetical protein [Anaerolineae bacterium]